MRSRWGVDMFRRDTVKRRHGGGKRGAFPQLGRPMRDGRSSFTFAHFHVSKTAILPDRSSGAGVPNARSAMARQRYIERRAPNRPEDIERDEAGRPSSFGTLGATSAARDRFWVDAHERERINGRVMGGLIVELPAEMSPRQRRRSLEDFCRQAFEERRLPYWAVVHRPDRHGDQRNFHGHVIYYDRPGTRDERDEWSFDGGNVSHIAARGPRSPRAGLPMTTSMRSTNSRPTPSKRASTSNN